MDPNGLLIQNSDNFLFFQAQTVDLKMAWLNEIRKILFKQQELIKGTFDHFLCAFPSAADAFLLSHCWS